MCKHVSTNHSKAFELMLTNSAFAAAALLLVVLAPVLDAQPTPMWLLGPQSLSCDLACPREPFSNDSTCYVDSLKFVRSPALFESAMKAAGLDDFSCSMEYLPVTNQSPSVYLVSSSTPTCTLSTDSTECAAATWLTSRLCCCGGPCPLTYTPKWVSAGVSIEAPEAHWNFDQFVKSDT
jgi:hypothetical protein